MGLSASQARLLTITARKSDCEFQSMRYSHQKIALSRSMTDLSTKYQNSLDQTKLVYNFYGESDTTTPLSYGLLMTPSQMNGYLPTLITDASGKVVLSSPYAAAARAAGIPQEGLGCLPSSTTRNKFLEALAKNGVISNETAETCMGIEYAQSMGMGTTDLVTTKVEQMTLEEMLEYNAQEGNLTQCNIGEVLAQHESTHINENGIGDTGRYVLADIESFGKGHDSDSYTGVQDQPVTIQQILTGKYTLLFEISDDDSKLSTKWGWAERLMNDIQNFEIWDWMFDELENMLNVPGDPNISRALAEARSKTEALLVPGNGVKTIEDKFKNKGEDKKNFQGTMDALLGYNGKRGSSINTNDYVGITVAHNTKKDSRKSEKFTHGVGISLTNIAKAFLTYFVEAMEGAYTDYYVSTDSDDRIATNSGNELDKYNREDSNLIGLDSDFKFDVLVDTGINTDQALISGFYDAIFNQLCTRGWVENNNITDDEYMQDMLKTGKLFLATCAEDGYYYQGNYETNSYISEISDEEAIAKAEAEYNTEKQKLTHKEEIIDLKMKNLDTEISSLTTEYDTVKSLISKNIEKGFKRYDA